MVDTNVVTQTVVWKMQEGRALCYMEIIARLKVGLDICIFLDLDVPNENKNNNICYTKQ